MDEKLKPLVLTRQKRMTPEQWEEFKKYLQEKNEIKTNQTSLTQTQQQSQPNDIDDTVASSGRV